MSKCTATIDVGGETLACSYPDHGDMGRHRHEDETREVWWDDADPSATLHAPCRVALEIYCTMDDWQARDLAHEALDDSGPAV